MRENSYNWLLKDTIIISQLFFTIINFILLMKCLFN